MRLTNVLWVVPGNSIQYLRRNTKEVNAIGPDSSYSLRMRYTEANLIQQTVNGYELLVIEFHPFSIYLQDRRQNASPSSI